MITLEEFGQKEIHWIYVDTVNFQTYEFRLQSSAEWFGYKSHSSGLTFEFVCALCRAKVYPSSYNLSYTQSVRIALTQHLLPLVSLCQIAWVKGLEPSVKMHDGTMFHGGTKHEKNLGKTAMYHILPAGGESIGDF